MNCLCMIICGLALFVNFWIPIMKRWWMLSELNSAFSLTLFLDDLLLTRFKLRINLMLCCWEFDWNSKLANLRQDVMCERALWLFSAMIPFSSSLHIKWESSHFFWCQKILIFASSLNPVTFHTLHMVDLFFMIMTSYISSAHRCNALNFFSDVITFFINMYTSSKKNLVEQIFAISD